MIASLWAEPIPFLLFQNKTVFSQAFSAPNLTSNFGNGLTISTCTSDTISFSASGDAGGSLQYEFFRYRSGSLSSLHSSPGPQNAGTFTASNFLNNDQVIARVWNTSQASATALTNTITVQVSEYPQLVSFSSNVIGNVICNQEPVTFSASSTSLNIQYQFCYT